MMDTTLICCMAAAIACAACLATVFQRSGTTQSGAPGVPITSASSAKYAGGAAQTVTVASSAREAVTYANTFHISCHTSRTEAILDFGVIAESESAAHAHYTLALSIYTAKRLLSALNMAISRHEGAFGVIRAERSTNAALHRNSQVSYVNFVRVSSTPEELILDCGLNPNPFAEVQVEITPSHTVAMLHDVAKQLATELARSLSRYEAANGVLETDVRNRVER